MKFCSKCNYSFDIGKSFGGATTEDKEYISKVSEAVKLLDSGKSLSDYKAGFTREELEKNSKYKKLSQENKDKFNDLFKINTSTNAQYKCNNCNFTEEITETVLLYQYDVQNKNIKIINLEENEFITKDCTLPRTKDYVCKNNKCTTHKKPKLKEAVFLRDKDSYHLTHICCVCFYSW